MEKDDEIMTNDKEIQELVEAGEKATQGEMVLAWEDGKHGVMAVKTGKLTLFVALVGNDGGDKNDERKVNAEFFTKAANARPALKALLAENKRLWTALKSIEWGRVDGKPLEWATSEQLRNRARQALKPSEEKFDV